MMGLVSGFGLIFATWLAVIGYLVAPVLFSELDPLKAGNLVGMLLSITNIVLLAGLFGLLVARWLVFKWLIANGLLVLSVILICVSEFWLSPKMQVIKEQYPLGLSKTSPQWETFMTLHGVYQLVFLALILVLVVWSVLNLNKLFLGRQSIDKKSL